jgi:mannose-6-phosphate isomerase-like protein (cupin superfamily)
MRASKNELTKAMDNEEMSVFEGVWGEMHVEYDIFKKRMDVTPLLKGLPNDRDPCPHWGIVMKGQMTMIVNGKQEVVKAGDAYYMPPGHTAIVEAGSEFWEFSPNDELQKTMKVIMHNLESASKKK